MARSSRGLMPPLELNRSSRAPLFRQIERGLREAILSGRLPAGTRIPSTRSLAVSFDVSRTTVLLAFDQLLARGLLEATPGGGTYVVDQLPQEVTSRDPDGAVAPTRPASTRGAALLDAPALPTDANSETRTFALALSAARDFPLDAWARAQAEGRRALAQGSGEGLGPAGHLRLRTAVARLLRIARGVVCDPDQVVVVSGVQEALYLVGTLLLDPGEAFWHGDPGHRGHRSVLEVVGGRPVAVPHDEHGFDVDFGRRHAPDARMAVLSPLGAFPVGLATAPARRTALLEWAREADAFVFEDDWDPASYLFQPAAPALASQDPDGRVIYTAGLSRAFSTVVRMTFLVLPKALAPSVISVRRRQQLLGLIEGQPPLLDQLTIADFLEGGHLEAMAGQRAERSRARHTALMEALRAGLGPDASLGTGDGMTYGVVWLPEGTDDRALAGRLAGEGLESLPATALWAEGAGRPGLVLGSAAFPEETIRNDIRRLVALLSES